MDLYPILAIASVDPLRVRIPICIAIFLKTNVKAPPILRGFPLAQTSTAPPLIPTLVSVAHR